MIESERKSSIGSVAAHAGLYSPWAFFLAAVVMGGVVAMSSTAITLKQLSDDGELGSQHGRLAFGLVVETRRIELPTFALRTRRSPS